MIVISGQYGMNDLKTDLQTMYNKAGVKDEGVMFLFTDGQITNERFLVYINDLLSSGDISDLYAPEDKDVLRSIKQFIRLLFKYLVEQGVKKIFFFEKK